MQSGSQFLNHILERCPVGWSQSPEDQKYITIPVESTRFNVQQSYQILQLNETLPLQINLILRKTLL